MNTEIKAQWTAALRSGEYKQGKGVLSRGGEFCCLGVLCDLAVKAGVVAIDRDTEYDDERVAYGAEGNVFGLPAEVVEWSGIYADDPEVDYEGSEYNVSQLNDGSASRPRRSFHEIADLIDHQL